MNRLPFTRVVAFTGWVVWPLSLWGLFIFYRITSQVWIESWATYAGSLQARIWFQEGCLRLLELSPDEKSHFSGRKEGEFEIWTWPHHTNSPWLAAGSGDQPFVEAVNRRMKHLWEQKDNGNR